MNDPHTPPPLDTSAPPLDMARVRLIADTKEEEEELLALFFHGADEKIAEMETVMSAATWPEWQKAAHYLKGSASNLGMHLFVAKCRQAELGPVLPQAEARALLAEIKAELRRVKEYTGQP